MPIKTNKQLINALVKDLQQQHPFLIGIFRERIQKISTLTRQAIETDPEVFDNPIFDHSWFISLCDIIDKHLGAEDKELS